MTKNEEIEKELGAVEMSRRLMELPDHEKYRTIAWLDISKELGANVVSAFADLAVTLDLSLINRQGSLEIRSFRSREERVAAVIRRERINRNDAERKLQAEES
jgi:hypothetical protein